MQGDPNRISTALVPLAKALLPIYFYFRHPEMKIRIVGNGLEKLTDLQDARVIICPNHTRNEDADIMFALSKMCGQDFYFLTAQEVIFGGGILQRLLQYVGCLPVSRGRSNVEVLENAQNLMLFKGRKMVVFPEGEISHLNDIQLPFKVGAFRIAMSTVCELRDRDNCDPVYILPLAIKYTFVADIQKSLTARISRLEARLELTPGSRSGLSLLRRICKISEILLSKVEREYQLEPEKEDTVYSRITTVKMSILALTASRLDVPVPQETSILEQAHQLQAEYFEQLLALQESAHLLSAEELIAKEKRLAAAEQDLKKVVNFVGVADSYLEGRCSQERYAEIVSLLEEELFGCAKSKDRQLILIDVGEPIDVAQYYDEYKIDDYGVIEMMKGKAAELISDMLVKLDDMRQPRFIGK